MARKARKKTTKKKSTAKKKTKAKKKATRAKKVRRVDASPASIYEPGEVLRPSELRQRLRMFWGLPLNVLGEIAKDPNTSTQDVILINQITNLCYTSEVDKFVLFLNLVLKGGTIPGLAFDYSEDDEDEFKRGQVQLMLPANGSENLDYYAPKDIVKGVISD